MEICLLCNQTHAIKNTTTIKRGLDTIFVASKIREDGLAASLESTNPLILHTDCRKGYTLPSNLKKIQKVREAEKIDLTDIW